MGDISLGDALFPPAPDREKLTDARQYCAEAMAQFLTGGPNDGLYQLICAVDHMLDAWQQ